MDAGNYQHSAGSKYTDSFKQQSGGGGFALQHMLHHDHIECFIDKGQRFFQFCAKSTFKPIPADPQLYPMTYMQQRGVRWPTATDTIKPCTPEQLFKLSAANSV